MCQNECTNPAHMKYKLGAVLEQMYHEANSPNGTYVGTARSGEEVRFMLIGREPRIITNYQRAA